ncbi:MAG: GNAT family N-acetyltransferase, partial [Rhodospirillales bacterium]|nr:GNAT family N-acetyltransferase [Rhodospirillales bacterium]
SDVFILPELQGKRLGHWLMETVIRCPELVDMDRWVLATSDAHEFYKDFGFRALPDAERYMVRRDE